MTTADRPIRVTHLIAPVRFGGGEALLSELIADSRPDLIESVVTVGRSSALDAALDASGTEHRSLGDREAASERAGRAGELRSALPLVPALRRHLRHLRPDVLHAHGFPPSLLGALPVAGAMGRVYTHHYERQPPGSAEARLLTTLFDRYDVLTTPADHLSTAMNQHFPHLRRPFRTLRVAIGDEFYDGRPRDRFRAGFDPGTALGVCVGRLIETKNQRLIVAALAALAPADRAGLGILLVGEGPDEAELRRQVAAAGLDDHVRFLGQVDRADMPDLLASADFGVFPTTTEASSIAAAEALAAGLPLLTLDIPSMVETAGAAGTFVGADPEAFGAGLLELAGRHAARAADARRRAEVFRLGVVRDHWAATYREVTSRR